MVLIMTLSGGCNSWGRVAPKGAVRNEIVEADVRKNLLADGITGLEVDVYDNGTAYLKGHVKTPAGLPSAHAPRRHALRRCASHPYFFWAMKSNARWPNEASRLLISSACWRAFCSLPPR